MKGTYAQSEMIMRIHFGGFHMMAREVSGDSNIFSFVIFWGSNRIHEYSLHTQ